ncbi:sugar transferase [Chamaesiphon sp. GL140_3_metabinner_50]|uniref:sugar transferase n=1 Tax=Chamaesiphon sp. GL140_3_metabinner_50 TaxID=2970812 RepID=UPI0025E393FA|nr:sugar transferase [Chamaesiphon sp. GL140_3_metabinner_50]
MTAASQPIKNKVVKSLAHKQRFHTQSQDLVKRLFDIIFSLLVLIFCSPIYLLLAVSIALTSSGGSIFYVQQRVGKNYRHFGCIKFRTMIPDADRLLQEMMAQSEDLRQEFDENYKLKADPRITKIGKFLRSTNLDEFPQFINVLKGEMSVVGPRPLVPEELERYGTQIDRVLTIRPGITGLWQVSGRNDIPYAQRIRIDVSYVRRRNFWLDLRIVLETVRQTIIPKNNGAY